MSKYSKYETVGGQADEAATYSVLTEHLRLAAEASYVLGHLRKSNDDDLNGTGFLAIGQLLERIVDQVTALAMKGRVIQ